jgi:hypothetical protein
VGRGVLCASHFENDRLDIDCRIAVVLDVAVGCTCPTKLDARRAFVSLVLTRQTKKYLHAQRRRENACEHVKR